MQKEKRDYTKKPKPRGDKVFIQVDIHGDQVPMIKNHIEKNGGSVASTVRDGLDELFKDDDK